MIYVFKDGSGWQEYPEPSNLSLCISVGGVTEQRIKAGDRYRLINDGEAIEFWTSQEVNDQLLADAKLSQRKKIDASRRAAELAGFSFTFPDGATGTIQIRNTDDKANISGLVVAAQANPGGAFGFRDGEDVTHPMTAADILALGNAVQAFITGNYATSWALKDQIQAAGTVAEVEAITWE